MKSNSLSRQPGSGRYNADQRAQLLTAFERSGLSGAAFARQQGIHYTTFCGWLRGRAKAQPAFAQVDLPAPQPPAQMAPAELVLELGAAARVRLNGPAQIALAARLVRSLNAQTLIQPPC